MDIKKKVMTVARLSRMERTKSLNFDLIIQRKKDIWDRKRKTMFVHSVLAGYPTPSLFTTKHDKYYTFLDGKQRVTTILSFIKDEFPLDKNFPEIDGYDLRNKTFRELPTKLQNRIMEYEFDVNIIENATEKEIEELFYRLNNGMPLRQIEKTRTILGTKGLAFVQEISDTPFFQEKINVTKRSKLRYVDQELVLQILTLIKYRDKGISGKELQNFAESLEEKQLQEALKTKIQNVCYYLNEAFPKREKFLRKIHIPMLFIIALENQEGGIIISPEEFGEWARTFFENLPEDYREACLSGSAKKENVQKRLRIMREYHNNYFKDKIGASKDYQKRLKDLMNIQESAS